MDDVAFEDDNDDYYYCVQQGRNDNCHCCHQNSNSKNGG